MFAVIILKFKQRCVSIEMCPKGVDEMAKGVAPD